MASKYSMNDRPSWPRRAIVTAGEPYGNKGLHFGHIAGVFVPADVYARFLRDRIGAGNVLFVSGTDCFGSPINEGYRKLVEAGDFDGTIAGYVQMNHDAQKAALDAYDISLDIFEGSGIGLSGVKQQEMTDAFITRLYDNGWLEKLSTPQFYDAQAGTFLNGRQVIGRCPVQGCKSEKAYADECDLGHQYDPVDLIAPKSALTGQTPEMREVSNWYFELPRFHDLIAAHIEQVAGMCGTRRVLVDEVESFLAPPIIYIQEKFADDFSAIEAELPSHSVLPAEKGKSSFGVEFASIVERERAVEVMHAHGLRFRTGKTLVPFRLTGNIEWGVKAPDLDGTLPDATVWCWPESLWAPIAFSQAALEESGRDATDWRAWWCSDDARVYQFIGQDNIYFYCIAQTAMWEALGWNLTQSTVSACYHLLYMGKKASSSSQTPPPPADDLLNHYTCEQMRAHWLSLGLSEKPVSFSPKAYDTRVTGKDKDGNEVHACDDKRVIDPALKESALLTGVFNRLARSCFYGVAVKEGDESPYRNGCIPAGAASATVVEAAEQAALAFEQAMYKFETHHALAVCDDYLRAANKRWSDASKAANKLEGEPANTAMTQALVDAFTELRVATVLMHGIVPAGCELICEYFDVDPVAFFSWDNIFASTDEFVESLGEKPGEHRVKPLPPRFDFFSKHESQY